jgi:hypothetical protein
LSNKTVVAAMIGAKNAPAAAKPISPIQDFSPGTDGQSRNAERLELPLF